MSRLSLKSFHRDMYKYAKHCSKADYEYVLTSYSSAVGPLCIMAFGFGLLLLGIFCNSSNVLPSFNQ